MTRRINSFINWSRLQNRWIEFILCQSCLVLNTKPGIDSVCGWQFKEDLKDKEGSVILSNPALSMYI